MPGIHFDDLSFRYTSAVDLFDHLTLHLGSAWTGSRRERDRQDHFAVPRRRGVEARLGEGGGRPARPTVISCPQTVEDLTDQVEEFAPSWEGSDSALRSRLGLDQADLRAGDVVSW